MSWTSHFFHRTLFLLERITDRLTSVILENKQSEPDKLWDFSEKSEFWKIVCTTVSLAVFWYLDSDDIYWWWYYICDFLILYNEMCFIYIVLYKWNHAWNFLFNSKYCKFYLVGYWILLYFYKYCWVLLWDAVKLLGISLILLVLAFRIC